LRCSSWRAQQRATDRNALLFATGQVARTALQQSRYVEKINDAIELGGGGRRFSKP
jgi:hypothetical protein